MEQYLDIQQQTGSALLTNRNTLKNRQRAVWWLSGALAAFLVVCFLPVGQIQMRGSQLKGLIGGQGYSGSWKVMITAEGTTVCNVTSAGGQSIIDGTTQWSLDKMTSPPPSIQAAYCYNVFPAYDSQVTTGNGSILVTCTWMGGPSNPPPPQIYVKKTVSAAWIAYYNYSTGPVLGTGSASDGLGDPDVLTPYGGASSGIHVVPYTPSNGVVSFSIPVSAAANLPALTGNGLPGGDDAVVIDCTIQIITPIVEGASTSMGLSYSPTWFSGTDCQAQGDASVDGGWISSALLKINGTTVNSFTDLGQEYTSLILPAVFDSTNFSDGSSITLTLNYTDNSGNNYTQSLTAPAYNKAYLLGNNSFTALGENIAALLQSVGWSASYMNHTVTSSSTANAGAILANIPSQTVFYIRTHGNTTGFGDCDWNNLGAGVWVYANPTPPGSPSISGATAAKETNVPVPNTWIYPPYNLVHLDACNCGGFTGGATTDAVANAFGIAAGCTDRACLCYNTEDIINEANAQWTERVWTFLSTGNTLTRAVMLSNADGQNQDVIEPGNNTGITSIRMIGDQTMKLHGVYQGNRLQWFITGVVIGSN